MSRESPCVGCDSQPVVVETADQRAHRDELVHVRRQPRHQFADINAGNTSRDRLKLAANLGGGLGLEVEHVEMRRSTRKEDHDHRFFRRSKLADRLGPKDLGQR